MSEIKFEVDQLKKAFGSFATGVCVATSHTSGFTVNSFASLSLNPPLMIFNIYKTETDYVEFLKKDKFAINFLSSDQKDISKLFASKETNKAENVAHQISKNGNIIIDNTLGFIELKVFQKIDIADHVLVIGEVENLSIDENRNPLIYYRSEYRDLKQKVDS